jgi:hypothetical protein
MGLFRKTPDEKAAVKTYWAAHEELERVSKADRKKRDDDAWNKANDAVWAARENVPWWRR